MLLAYLSALDIFATFTFYASAAIQVYSCVPKTLGYCTSLRLLDLPKLYASTATATTRPYHANPTSLDIILQGKVTLVVASHPTMVSSVS